MTQGERSGKKWHEMDAQQAQEEEQFIDLGQAHKKGFTLPCTSISEAYADYQ